MLYYQILKHLYKHGTFFINSLQNKTNCVLLIRITVNTKSRERRSFLINIESFYLTAFLPQAMAFRYWWTSSVCFQSLMWFSWVMEQRHNVSCSPQSSSEVPTAGRLTLQQPPPWLRSLPVTSPADHMCFSAFSQSSRVLGYLVKCKPTWCRFEILNCTSNEFAVNM